ncbi:MAG: 50S ribosomal protein L15 [Gammaproteobacteria bacterium]|nr:50S ribosomal protein L15 [Gammaproteobacteria bacterium]MCP4089145.1 50S ribosomal protein L15 [Gammaproteobacteria bacterium]MCP4276831.1 50S ribosomal protein L15 [Gammaproteobacteria bacterium]MCP4830674.1 50S ribosomal protein L15 [Gammaproteobacteria bacterium]MCP4928483.1 50S ribosomal protein L15 [Gammaproteobacteria bacterium]
MKLNSMGPVAGSKPTSKRLGRGHSAGQGKTCGRGQKGQKARSGGYHKVGFEGGQMPIHRRLPKVGFRSAKARTYAEVRLSELNAIEEEEIDLLALKRAGVIAQQSTRAKVFASGEVSKAVKLRGVGVTKGAREAIEKAGGSIEE